MHICILLILSLKDFLNKFFGNNFPIEIIELIILQHYEPAKVNCGHNHTIIYYNGLYLWGRNVTEGNIDGKKRLHFDPQDILPILLPNVEIKGYDGYLCSNKYTMIPALENINICDFRNVKIPAEFFCGIKKIDCGMGYTCAIAHKNEIYVWGFNHFGQLGLGDFNNYDTPQKLNLLDVTSINCGGNHTIALTKNNKIYVWGANEEGQLGIGNYNDSNIPIELFLPNMVSISCGGFHNIALMYDGKIYVWGFNLYGQLGLGDKKRKNKPYELILSNVISAKCGINYSIALTKKGEMWSWGTNFHNQLGLDFSNEDQSVPRKVSLSHIISFDCGDNHVVAVTLYNKIYVWGDNYYGQLGLKGYYDRKKPCLVEWMQDLI